MRRPSWVKCWGAGRRGLMQSTCGVGKPYRRWQPPRGTRARGGLQSRETVETGRMGDAGRGRSGKARQAHAIGRSVVLLYRGGLRCGEGVQLDVADFDSDTRTVRVRRGKATNRTRRGRHEEARRPHGRPGPRGERPGEPATPTSSSRSSNTSPSEISGSTARCGSICPPREAPRATGRQLGAHREVLPRPPRLRRFTSSGRRPRPGPRRSRSPIPAGRRGRPRPRLPPACRRGRAGSAASGARPGPRRRRP